MKGRMSARQIEAHTRWWKSILFCFAAGLMLDLVYLGVSPVSGRTKAVCLMIAVALLCACVYAVRELYRAGYREGNAVEFPDERYDPPVTATSNVADLFPGNDD